MPCKICQSGQSVVIRDTLRYDIKRDVLQCSSCSFVYLSSKKKVADDYYSSGAAYRKQYGPDLTRTTSCQEIFDTYLPAQGSIIDEIKHVLGSDASILDVGCSTGHFLTAIKDHVGTRVGLELGRDAVTFIREKLDFSVYDVPIEQAVITEGPFDIITALQVLEHIEDPISFLKAINKNLKPGGYLYLELPNINDVLVSTYKIEGYINFFYHEPHVSYFSATTLQNLLSRVDFSGEIKTTQRYTVLNHLNWLLTNAPQKNFLLGNRTPMLVTGKTIDTQIKDDFNTFIKLADAQYKNLIIKHGLGESLTFLGQKI